MAAASAAERVLLCPPVWVWRVAVFFPACTAALPMSAGR